MSRPARNSAARGAGTAGRAGCAEQPAAGAGSWRRRLPGERLRLPMPRRAQAGSRCGSRRVSGQPVATGNAQLRNRSHRGLHAAARRSPAAPVGGRADRQPQDHGRRRQGHRDAADRGAAGPHHTRWCAMRWASTRRVATRVSVVNQSFLPEKALRRRGQIPLCGNGRWCSHSPSWARACWRCCCCC